MVIRCPECATRFKVADHLIGDKPVKLKCSKCRTVFTYQRRSEPVRSEAPSHPRMPVVRPGGKMIGAPAGEPKPEKKMIGAPAEPETAPSLDEQFESFEAEEPAAEESFESFEAEEPAAGEEEEKRLAGVKERGVMEVDEEEHTAVFEAAIDRRAAARAAEKATAPPPVQDAEAASQPSLSGPAITLEDVLPAPEPASSKARAVGILSAALLGFVLVFGLFVMWRNGWDLAALLQDPVHAMRVSLGLAPHSLVSDEARDIDATVSEWFRATTAGDHTLLVVNGEVFNSSAYPKTAVIVEVAIVNSQGVDVFKQEAAAGITLLTKQEMEDRSVLEIREQMQADEQRARSWIVQPNRRASFQVFFTSYPPGVDDPMLYTIEASVTSARNAIEE